MINKRKTWTEKMDNGRSPKIVPLEKDCGGMKKGDMMLISSPYEIRDYIKSIPKGQTKTLLELRTDIAKKHNADGMCPLTAGIFLRINAEAAIEELNQGKSPEDITPFWRVVEPDSPMAKKVGASFMPPFDSSFIKEMRDKEGIIKVANQ